MRLILNILILSLSSLTACQKSNETPAQPEKVVIDIQSPASDLTVKHGDTLRILASVSYISRLHGYKLKLTDDISGNILFEKEDHTHDDHFLINENWIDTLTYETGVTLQVTTVIDHEGNTAQKEINFKNQL